MAETAITEWNPAHGVDGLAELHHATVYAGASVSFIVPFSIDEARAFWADKVLPGVLARTRRVVIAELDGRVVGTVQLDMATPPNQRHRADVAKLLVHPEVRRLGIARSLMTEVESIALAEGRTLLTLDTVRGNHAEALYQSMGYTLAGIIPGYARGALSPELEDTCLFYKNLTVGGAC